MEEFILCVLCLLAGMVIGYGYRDDQEEPDLDNLHYPHFKRRK